MSSPAPTEGPASSDPGRCDVCIVGAGLAGATLAFALGRAGIAVTLIDSRARCSPTFKAEKLEPDQTALLERLGLRAVLDAASAPIRNIDVGSTGRVIERLEIEQRGALYHDMVNAVRASLPAAVRTVVARVTGITPGDDGARVTLADDRVLTARLVVLATGVMAPLMAPLGLERRVVSDPHSVAFGFTIAPAPGRTFPFDAVTYLPERFGDAVDYLTLFAIPGGMRANLFVYQDVKSPFVRAFHDDPRSQLRRLFPGLERIVGAYEVVSKVEARPIDLWVTADPARDGVVLAGDACQSVCPATGSGLSKVLTDAAVLADLIPAWLATPGMPSDKVASFYAHPLKRTVDADSLQAALYRRRLNTDTSIVMRVHRLVELARLAWRGRRTLAAR